MIKITLLLCLVWGCLGQFSDPDWRDNGWAHGSQRFPPLPRSFPIFANTQPTLAPKSTTKPTTPVTTPPAPTSTKAPSTCSGMFSCADCNTAQVCRPSPTGYVQLYTLPCSATTPYCNADSGSCSATPDSTCGLKDSFICPSDGYFPDPTNCTIYHACNNYQSQMFKCAAQQVYDPEASECKPGTNCINSVNCDGVSQSKSLLGNTHYYAYCSGGHPLVVDRCPGNYKLNTTSQVCEAICEEEGLMKDEQDCTKYYQCKISYINSQLSQMVRTNLDCPTGEAFDASYFQCIPKTMTSCNK